jgi:hypothetical protein
MSVSGAGRLGARLRALALAAGAVVAQATLQSLLAAELGARWRSSWAGALDGAALAAGLLLGALALWRWRRGRGLPPLVLDGTAALALLALLAAGALWAERPLPLGGLMGGETCGRTADALESQA